MGNYAIWLGVGVAIISAYVVGRRLGKPVWKALRCTRGVWFILLIGIALFLTPQGRELLVVAGDGSTAAFWVVFAVAILAAQSWHWARTALSVWTLRTCVW